MNEIAGEEENQDWGLSLFGDQVRLIVIHYVKCCFRVSKDLYLYVTMQKIPIPSPHVDLDSCCLLKEFMSNQLNLVVDLTVDEGLLSMTSLPLIFFFPVFKVIGFLYNSGTTFLEGLLVNGWLTRLILTCARVEKFICKWTLNICACPSSLFNFVYSMDFGLLYGF